MLIDSHAHLTDERLYKSVDDIVKSMDTDGLSKIVTVGYDRESSMGGAVLARKYDKIYATLGIHPHDAQFATKTDYDYFRSFQRDERVIAIGEIGLDFYYDRSPRDVQENVFVQQLELAAELNLPVVLHVRDAYEKALTVLRDNRAKLQCGGLLHCYGGSVEMMKQFLDLGLCVSYGGAITFKNAEVRREVVKATPIDRLLVETDCPYLTPEPHRGEVNLPKYAHFVAAKIAELKNIEKEELENVTTQTAYRVFKKMK